MKRYVLFICEAYYPSGGWHDFAGTADDIADLEPQIVTLFPHRKQEDRWFKFNGIVGDQFHIVDTDDGTIVRTDHDVP